MLSQATYLWLDGAVPTQTLRSKMRIVPHSKNEMSIRDFPEWGFDGSSTNQATGHDSDLILKPVFFTRDPINGAGNYLVLCEVLNPDGTPHSTNKRAKLRELMTRPEITAQDPWIGFEQEYTLFRGTQPLGWPERGYPAPQGPFYCGVGADEVFGREMIEDHTKACIEANLMIFGVNAEVMPGQWEFQIGYRGLSDELADPLTVSDHLWVARWLLYRIGEHYDISAKLHPKPVKGDWNGAGKHTNFSTKAMRDPKTGMTAIHAAIDALRASHHSHIKIYGHGLEERLTGRHETAPMDQFSSGIGHRGASVRIPRGVATAGCGYLEDRRPGANANPYEVAFALLSTICVSAKVVA
ncbi:MAG: glutamine synthetase [Gammaproteobacteria bacterium RIFCSPLOWO2_02_FULL_42_14]|nr:MAG: glutamine synthetase [Gammaproteobacteria bacterium RIFCSPHIGHO2_02_FULL_42_43]OGT53653.1 MAG: glutamine synthetase [Gammaproteobacteria bacterium RIFCSPHIGHO2_12_FULL_41_25]OGT62718.1 MAG: glutamine synthetase [Gammaproteobacteria bacterium RIFCSPLOWO2_02_FULL_42_14]OGT85621.1 MAG: glutamine synthetase [Gammaproteobacteria bacterium RIFCSPLOWO2_12_FULL_42_18]